MPEEHNGGAKGPWGEVGKRTGRAEREVSQRTYQKEEKDSVGKRRMDPCCSLCPGEHIPAVRTVQRP